MLRYCDHQAEGLVTLGDCQSPRLLAVVQHGDEPAELPFLWQLCLTFTQQAYSVTVLDATSTESPANPGLLQQLERGAPVDTASQPVGAWTVLPARDGLIQLSVTSQPHQRGWHHLLRNFVGTGVIILYCNAEGISHVLKGLEAPILLPVSPARSSLLSGYLALKRLLILGGHRPTIIDVQSTDENPNSAGGPAVCTSLVECAKNFLNFEVKVIPFADIADDVQTAVDFNRFALGLLEADSAGPVRGSALAVTRSQQQGVSEGVPHPFSRMVDVHR